MQPFLAFSGFRIFNALKSLKALKALKHVPPEFSGQRLLPGTLLENGEKGNL